MTERTWTDEQDELGYDTFRTLAECKGAPVASDLMLRFKDMGAAFGEVDLRAWIWRYEEEEDVIPHPPSAASADDYSRMYDQYMSLRKG